VFFKEEKRVKRKVEERDKVKKRREGTSASSFSSYPLFKGLETTPYYLTLKIYKRPLLSKGELIVY
jgi:hypothetical protein